MDGDPVVYMPQSKQPVAVAALIGERQRSTSLLLSSYIEPESEFLLELRVKFSLEACVSSQEVVGSQDLHVATVPCTRVAAVHEVIAFPYGRENA